MNKFEDKLAAKAIERLPEIAKVVAKDKTLMYIHWAELGRRDDREMGELIRLKLSYELAVNTLIMKTTNSMGERYLKADGLAVVVQRVLARPDVTEAIAEGVWQVSRIWGGEDIKKKILATPGYKEEVLPKLQGFQQELQDFAAELDAKPAKS